MAELIRCPNYPDINVLTGTVLDADAAAGQKNITLLNPAGFTADDKINIGPLDANTAEIGIFGTLTGNIVAMSGNLAIAHKKFEAFTKLFGDQIKLYSAPNLDGTIPADTSFAPVGSAVNIDASQAYTTVTDPSGSAAFWYKITYFNSHSSAETSLALSVAMRGGGYGHYVSIEDIRHEAGVESAPAIDDTQIATRRDQAESEVKGYLAGAGYTMPLQTANGTFFVPFVVENVTRLLAAGFVLIQDYGPVSGASTKDGEQKLRVARDMLARIQDRTVILLDITEQPLAKINRVQFYPNDLTASAGPDGVTPEPARFTMGKKY